MESFAPLAGSRGVTVRTTHRVTRLRCADRDALRQVLLNLLDNAVKYGPAGQTIDRRNACGRERGRVQLWVDDQGAGIAARDKARVWEPFRRLDRAVEAGNFRQRHRARGRARAGRCAGRHGGRA